MKLGKIGSADMMHHGFTAKSYVQDGLVFMWDATENAGWGVHDSNTSTWKDLVGGVDFTFGSGLKWGPDYVTTTGAQVTGTLTKQRIQSFGTILGNAAQGTFEYCLNKLVDAFNPEWANGSGQGVIFYTQLSNGKVVIRNQGGAMNGTGYFFWNTKMTTNALHTIAFGMKSAQKCKLYVDGEYKESSEGNCNFAVNLLKTGNYAFQFKIRTEKTYCVRVYNRELTAAEISANNAVDRARFNLP